MKAQDIAKLHASTITELQAKIETNQKELVETRLNTKMGKEKNTKKAFNIRKEIAIIKTIISEKQRETQKADTKKEQGK